MNDSSDRLAQIARLLVDDGAEDDAAGAAGRMSLRGLRLHRIQRLAETLEARAFNEPDDVDWVVMRLLLEEYAAAVAYLRVAVGEKAAQLAIAARTLSAERFSAEHWVHLQEKRYGSLAPLEPPPANRTRGT